MAGAQIVFNWWHGIYELRWLLLKSYNLFSLWEFLFELGLWCKELFCRSTLQATNTCSSVLSCLLYQKIKKSPVLKQVLVKNSDTYLCQNVTFCSSSVHTGLTFCPVLIRGGGTYMLRHTGMCCPNGLHVLFHWESLDMGSNLVKKILRGRSHFTKIAKIL